MNILTALAIPFVAAMTVRRAGHALACGQPACSRAARPRRAGLQTGRPHRLVQRRRESDLALDERRGDGDVARHRSIPLRRRARTGSASRSPSAAKRHSGGRARDRRPRIPARLRRACRSSSTVSSTDSPAAEAGLQAGRPDHRARRRAGAQRRAGQQTTSAGVQGRAVRMTVERDGAASGVDARPSRGSKARRSASTSGSRRRRRSNGSGRARRRLVTRSTPTLKSCA